MTRCWRLAGLLLWLAVSAQASDMKRVVRAVESNLGVHHTHIPMLGAALLMSNVVTGFQTPAVKLAVFEDQDLSAKSPAELENAVVGALGREWIPLVKSSANHGSAQTWIYVREDGKNLSMFIASAEHNELSLVEVKLSERQMRRWIHDTDEMAKSSGSNALAKPCEGRHGLGLDGIVPVLLPSCGRAARLR